MFISTNSNSNTSVRAIAGSDSEHHSRHHSKEETMPLPVSASWTTLHEPVEQEDSDSDFEEETDAMFHKSKKSNITADLGLQTLIILMIVFYGAAIVVLICQTKFRLGDRYAFFAMFLVCCGMYSTPGLRNGLPDVPFLFVKEH